jgi:amidophosphoribosyltransferase
MAKINDFIAFRAAVALLKDRGLEKVLSDTYEKCKAELMKPLAEMQNPVTAIYDPFTADEVSDKISELLTPKGMVADVKIIFQTIEGLHEACPNHTGDWYFTGNYPTPGGRRVVNRAFVNYMEGSDKRAY